MAQAQPKIPATFIQPNRGWLSLGFKELWDRRELLYFFAWRDVRSRYKQSLLGVAWVFIQPLMTMIVFSVLFGRLAKLPSDGVPYPIFTYSALLGWNLFSQSLSRSTSSVVANGGLVQRVYFPRLLIPTSSILSVLVDFLIAFLVVFGLMAYYRYAPTLAILTLPLFMLMAMGAALGVGLWLSALNVRFRDINHTIPFVIQMWMYATPVAYSLNVVPERWHTLYALNPLVGIIEGFRWAILKTATPGSEVVVSAIVIVVVLVSGIVFFRRMEKHFADVV